MTGGWAATNTLRGYKGCVLTEDEDVQFDAALALVEAALDAAERVADAPTAELYEARDALAAALRAVREGK